MIANHVHDALAQVRKMQELVLAKRNFRGYSGTARILGGGTAMLGAFSIHFLHLPKSPLQHLAAWGLVLCVSLLLNYVALIKWFLLDPEAERDPLKLLPAFDAIPALVVGAVLSISLILHHHYDLLFGVWMSLYGLAHVSYRMSLPGENYIVGLFYICCGAVCLFLFNDFFNPWPMGIVFFIGETAGGMIFNEKINR